MSIIHERIKQVRTSMGYTVQEFADILGVHRSSIYRYEGSEKEIRDIPFDSNKNLSKIRFEFILVGRINR